MKLMTSVMVVLCALAIVTPADAAQIIVNEYNAVEADGFLPEGKTDTFFNRVEGNGGDWFELVVIEDNLNIQNWTIDIFEKGDGVDDTLEFTNADIWSDLRSGSIITFAEDVPDDFSYDPAAGDWWINVQVNGDGDGTYITATNIRITKEKTRFEIKNAAGVNVFGPAGEGVSPASGVGGSEVWKLEGDPSAAITPGSDLYTDGSSSSFGSPNPFGDGAGGDTVQNFAALRSVVGGGGPTSISLSGGGETYRQDFDADLGPSGAADTVLPAGWSASVDRADYSSISQNFPPAEVVSGTYNVGEGDDRALAPATAIDDENVEVSVQFEITESDARAWRVLADLETWAIGSDTLEPLGMSYDITLEYDGGIVPLGTPSKALEKTVVGTEIRDGNAAANRISFDSGIVEQAINVGSLVNLRFNAREGFVPFPSRQTIVGVDNVVVRALAPGDADGNGVVDVADLLTLLGGQKFNQGAGGVTWAQGDFNADDQFNTGDLLAMLAFLSGTFPSDPYASEAGASSDAVADIIVNSETGEVTVDLAGHTVSAIIIESASEIFNGTQPDWDTTSQFPSTLPGELGNVLFTATASGVDELGAMISAEFLGRDKEFYLQDLDLNILIASEGGALTKGNVIVVPEPSALLLVGLGSLALVGVVRRRAS